MEVIKVLKPNKYNIYIGNNITYRMLERFTFDKALVIADNNLDHNDIDNVLAAFPNSYLYLLEASEASKSIDNYQLIIDKLISLDFGKCDYIIGFGGGVTLDLAGYVAATYKRGINLIYVPTSVLAMVDASVGGKVGINYHDLKNVIGTIYTPEMVIIDPFYLHSLPKRHYNNGLMEAYKMGLTLNKDIIEAIHSDDIVDIIKLAIMAKADVVNVDPYDKCKRHVLNFAHTIAHAVELATDEFYHGEIVASCFNYFIIDNDLKKQVDEDLKQWIDASKIREVIRNNKDIIIANIKNDKKVVNSHDYYVKEVFLNKLCDYEFQDIKLSDYEVMIDE